MNPNRNRPSVSSVTDLFSEQQTPSEDSDIVYLHDFEKEALEELQGQGAYAGISTGYKAVNDRIGSFLPGELFTIGGDTGHGKSLFAMNVAQNVYKETGKPVLLVNLELTRNQAVQRFYNISGDGHDYRGILIQKTPQVNYRDIDRLMRSAKEKGACLVIIDHLHFFNDSIGDNAASALTRIVKHFKESAVREHMPVILLSHVTPTMKPDGTTNRPDLHSFKGSRSIEQLSDMVGFVFRDDKNPKTVDFYVKKNRSRPLDSRVVPLRQIGWQLHEGSEFELAEDPFSKGH